MTQATSRLGADLDRLVLLGSLHGHYIWLHQITHSIVPSLNLSVVMDVAKATMSGTVARYE